MSKRKYFSKIIYIFLVTLFVYNSFGYLLLYYPVQTITKYIVQKAIHEKEIKKEDLCVLTFNVKDLNEKKYDLIWKKPGKEFKFNGKMYDIEDKVVRGDTIYFTVYYDHKENILEELFSLYQQDYKKDKAQNLANRIILLGLFSEETKSFYSNLQNRTATDIPLQKTEAGLLNNYSDVITPPPRKLV